MRRKVLELPWVGISGRDDPLRASSGNDALFLKQKEEMRGNGISEAEEARSQQFIPSPSTGNFEPHDPRESLSSIRVGQSQLPDAGERMEGIMSGAGSRCPIGRMPLPRSCVSKHCLGYHAICQ